MVHHRLEACGFIVCLVSAGGILDPRWHLCCSAGHLWFPGECQDHSISQLSLDNPFLPERAEPLSSGTMILMKITKELYMVS